MRPRALLGLVPLLALALAGCLATPELLAPSALPPLVPRFLAPVAMEQDAFGAEPNIAVLPDGTLFIASVAGAAGKPNVAEGAGWLWRSTDGGATWDTLRRPGTMAVPGVFFCSCDADVVGSPDGWVYYTDWWYAIAFVPGVTGAGIGNYLVERSRDGGQTWEQSPVTIPLLDGAAIDRQWLAADGNGTVLLAYAYYHPVQNAVMGLGDLQGRGPFMSSIQVARSTDHGASWESPATALAPVPGSMYLHAKPALLPDGSFAMAFGETPVDYLNGPGRAGVAFSDDGRAWRTRYVADVPEGFESVWPVQAAADARGTVHVAWNARTGDTITLFYSATPDRGATWTPPEAIRAEGINALPWVTARGDGEVAVGWYGGDATGDPREASENATWYAYAAERRGGGPWSLGRVSDEPVKVGPFCPLGSACGANDRELLDYVSLIHDPAGRVHYAYARSEPQGEGATARVLYAGTVPPAAVP